MFFLLYVHRVVEHDSAVDAVMAQVEAVVGTVVVEFRVRICIACMRYVLGVVAMDDLSH